MAKLIHAMIRVLEEDRSINFYKDAFGLEVEERMDFETFTLVYLRNDENDIELDLTVNIDQTEPYQHGEAYGHVAFCVDDLDAEHARFEKHGYEPRKIVAFEDDGKLLARFFFVKDPDGYSIEVLQNHGRYR